MTEVLIFVPGILGSELWDRQGKVWPGSLTEGLFGFGAEKFSRLCADDLEPRDIMREAAGVINIYGSWIRAFERLRSRDTNGPLFNEAAETLIVVPYDWRKPNEQAAERVAAAIAHAVDTHGPDVTIHLAAHSMGGLVCRYLLQSGAFEGRQGLDRVVTLITFGAPHKGAVGALAAALGLDKAQFLSAKQTQTLANDPRFPALYQLMPQRGTAMVWDARSESRLHALDIFDDPAFAAKIGLSAKGIESAKNFHAGLNGPMPDVRVFLFVGTRFETPTHILWNGNQLTVVKSKDGGDGTVTLQGSILENHQMRFTDKSHISLMAADETQQGLQTLFNADGLYAISPETTVSLSVSDLVIEHRGRVEIGLIVKGEGKSIEGSLFLERARPDSGAQEIAEDDFDLKRPEHASELTYNGPELTSLHVFIDDVLGPAVYRPVFATKEVNPRRFVGPAFIVKKPEVAG